MAAAEQYRARAQEAELFSKAASTPEHQEAWRKIADGYLALADQTERQQALGPLGSLRGDPDPPDRGSRPDTGSGNQTDDRALSKRSE